MPELIDKHAAYMVLKHEAETHGLSYSAEAYDRAARIIDQMPTIEPEVRHGRWLNTDETVWDAKDIDGKQQLVISIVSARCSVCNHWAEQVNNFPPYMKYEFCPHCGADMREGGADNAESD